MWVESWEKWYRDCKERPPKAGQLSPKKMLVFALTAGKLKEWG